MHKRTGMTAALAVSVFLHAVITALLSLKQPEHVISRPATVLALQLKRYTPHVPEKSASTPIEPSRSPPAPSVAPHNRSPTVPQAELRDWSEVIRNVVRAQPESNRSKYVAPPLQNPGFTQAPAAQLPDLAGRFRPAPRKICGKEAEFEVGMQKFSMPVIYACDDKQSEYRDAPVRQQFVEESTEFDGD